MAWQTPKTNWTTSDYFNLNPDYDRISGNIEYLNYLGEKLYGDFPHPTLGEYTINGWPYANFLNDIVDSVTALENYCFKPAENRPMRTYEANAPGWSATDLNIIERNILNLYAAFERQTVAIPKLPIQLGVMQI